MGLPPPVPPLMLAPLAGPPARFARAAPRIALGSPLGAVRLAAAPRAQTRSGFASATAGAPGAPGALRPPPSGAWALASSRAQTLCGLRRCGRGLVPRLVPPAFCAGPVRQLRRGPFPSARPVPRAPPARRFAAPGPAFPPSARSGLPGAGPRLLPPRSAARPLCGLGGLGVCRLRPPRALPAPVWFSVPPLSAAGAPWALRPRSALGRAGPLPARGPRGVCCAPPSGLRARGLLPRPPGGLLARLFPRWGAGAFGCARRALPPLASRVQVHCLCRCALGLAWRSGSASLPPERHRSSAQARGRWQSRRVLPCAPPVPAAPAGGSGEARGLRPGGSRPRASRAPSQMAASVFPSENKNSPHFTPFCPPYVPAAFPFSAARKDCPSAGVARS